MGKSAKKYKGITISDTKTQRLAFENTKSNFLSNIVTQMNNRFPMEAQDLLVAFAVLGLRGITFVEETELQAWGNDKLDVLLAKYGTEGGYVTPQQAVIEWGQLKILVIQQMYPTDSMFILWKLIASNHGDLFPNLITLANIALVFPVHTADVERGFSVQNSIKTDLRNRISSERLNTLMTIRVEGPPLEQFDYAKALKVFRDAKKRKVLNKV